MILNEFYVIDYLMEKGYLATESLIADSTFLIKNHSQRSNCYSIEHKEISLFLKQQPINAEYKNQSFRHEALLYNTVLHEVDLAPALVFFDPDNDILCLEYLRAGQNLYEYIRGQNQYPPAIIRQLAEKISNQHNIPYQADTKSKPWIMQLHTKAAFRYQPKTEAAREIIEFVQTNQTFCDQIEALNESFAYNAFVHNDLKTNNILCSTQAGKFEVRLIDWEFARSGDRYFDLGTLLGSWLFFWAGNKASMDKMDSFDFLKALFIQYRKINQITDDNYFSQITKYAGLRLIQFCLEATIEEKNTFRSFKKVLQLSFNLLQNDNLLVKYFTSND